MSHPETDTLRLRHMLDAARAALGFTSGRTRDDLSADLMLQFALVRALEIVGEAAARMSEPTRTGHPEIPWTAIVGYEDHRRAERLPPPAGRDRSSDPSTLRSVVGASVISWYSSSTRSMLPAANPSLSSSRRSPL